MTVDRAWNSNRSDQHEVSRQVLVSHETVRIDLRGPPCLATLALPNFGPEWGQRAIAFDGCRASLALIRVACRVYKSQGLRWVVVKVEPCNIFFFYPFVLAHAFL